MRSSVNVNMSDVIARAERLSAFQWRQAPSSPSEPNTTARLCRTPSFQSCPHCQVKYCHHIMIWAQ